MKKLLSALLCAALLFSLCLMPVQASEEPAPAETVLPDETAPENEPAPAEADNAAEELPGEEPMATDASSSPSYQWTVDDGTLTITGSGIIPLFIEGGATAPWYDQRDHITRIVVSEGITSIGCGAFRGLDKVTEIVLPSDIAVRGTLEGTSIQWQIDPAARTLTLSGAGPMPDCKDGECAAVFPWFAAAGLITKIVVGSGITAIGDHAFERMFDVTRAELPEGVTRIGSHAFHYDLSLTDIVLPSTVTEIGDHAFEQCNALAQIQFPASLKTIGVRAFSFTDLKTLSFPDGIEHIGQYAFSPTGSFTEVTLPGSLKTLTAGTSDSDSPFRDYPHLKTATIGEGITALPSLYFGVSYDMETLNLPSTIQTLGHDFILLSVDHASLKTIHVAPREGYEFLGWVDEDGTDLTSEDICARKEYTGDLTALWVRTWTEGMFTDVSENAWYHDAVQFCYQTELMNGMSATAFQPNGTGTRAQVVTILYRLAGSPAVSTPTKLSDVKPGLWYSDAVAWAEANGITTGYEDGTFRPVRSVSRQEFVTFLYRMAGYLGLTAKDAVWEDTYCAAFPDAFQIASWARTAENWSVAVGLQHGSKDSTGKLYLRPASTVTRAELATYLTNYSTELNK